VFHELKISETMAQRVPLQAGTTGSVAPLVGSGVFDCASKTRDLGAGSVVAIYRLPADIIISISQAFSGSWLYPAPCWW
jgi:hypothetical protein